MKLFDFHEFSIFEEGGEYSYLNNRDGRKESFDFIEGRGSKIKSIGVEGKREGKRMVVEVESGRCFSLSPGIPTLFDFIIMEKYDQERS